MALPDDPAEIRARRGRETFREVLCFEGDLEPTTPFGLAARDFVFSEVWARPGLDRRSRRWITLTCVTAAGSLHAMRAYAHAALASGDMTMAELREFVLQFAAFQGFPKAVEFERILDEFEQPSSL